MFTGLGLFLTFLSFQNQHQINKNEDMKLITVAYENNQRAENLYKEPELSSPEVADFRKGQIEVQNGWITYDKKWKERAEKRSKHKDGIIFEGAERVPGQENKALKKVVIYDVSDLIYDVPNFKSPMSYDKEELVTDETSVVAPSFVYETKSKQIGRKVKTRQLEKLIQDMLDEPKTAKIVDLKP